jgi:DNA primase
MDHQALEQLKHQVSLLDYLQQQDWKPTRNSSGSEVAGLCPFHSDTRPSFYVHRGKNLFYCHGCGRGGDLIGLVKLYHGLSFTEAVAHLRQRLGNQPMLEEAVAFYRMQFRERPEGRAYLTRRGIYDAAILEALGTGYAPGASLRAHLSSLGYGLEQMGDCGLIDSRGRDVFYRRVVFPCGSNLYGRSLDDHVRHRFLRGDKGGLYRWDRVANGDDIVLVEGMFDVAALWQAGFSQATCGWGAHLNAVQRNQLESFNGAIGIVFDSDPAGYEAAAELTARLRRCGRKARCAWLPDGHDPASFLAAGGSVAEFQALLKGRS